MPLRTDIKKVMVIGSGPIIIGQAAEFDYSGSQACKSLREEGFQTVLVNSNPATIQTDPDTADIIYIEPLVPGTLAKIIEKERPDGILPSMGGQTGLNLVSELSDRGALDGRVLGLLGRTHRRDRFERGAAPGFRRCDDALLRVRPGPRPGQWPSFP